MGYSTNFHKIWRTLRKPLIDNSGRKIKESPKQWKYPAGGVDIGYSTNYHKIWRTCTLNCFKIINHFKSHIKQSIVFHPMTSEPDISPQKTFLFLTHFSWAYYFKLISRVLLLKLCRIYYQQKSEESHAYFHRPVERSKIIS